MDSIFEIEKYRDCAARVCAEGAVLLENHNDTLPLSSGCEIALFGRSQNNYYKSGTGSGGMVNVEHVIDLPEALSGHFKLNLSVRNAYNNWVLEHPYDEGTGWGQEPWFQEEMPVSDELAAEAAKTSAAAVIVIGRTAGEDQDNKNEPGSWLLTEGEEKLLECVCRHFDRTVVLLNTGNIIDMSWVQKFSPSAVMYIWQGGEVGCLGIANILDGTVSPSGRLPDTVALIENYPSTKNFGNPDRNIYAEDIYVGYRYFETFAPGKVLYPFGYGLSYTSFDICAAGFSAGTDMYSIKVKVTNTGIYAGKQVVQCYVSKPMGKLGQPAYELAAYGKTEELRPGQTAELVFEISRYSISSYDDSGVTGHRSCYVMEEGEYRFFIGSSIRDIIPAGSAMLDNVEITAKLEEALAPVTPFDRLIPVVRDGKTLPEFRPVPCRSTDPLKRRAEKLPAEIAYTGSRSISLNDVRMGKAAMNDFIAQLSDEDLCCIQRGEGMNSPKVTPGTGGAFAGVTDSLLSYGIPITCCSDGPSGIRMDCGMTAFSMPNGTCMAASFNDSLIRELYEWESLELRKTHIDVLLGPGLNIHRNPLNGRNFEYFSEDPLLTGNMAAAQLQGLHKYGTTGCIKHFAGNNQEYRRHYVDSVVSERAVREIYLKPFELAVKNGHADCVMSSYGVLNGIYTASNFDLLTTILRGEWGFNGVVMTDWWAKGAEEGCPGMAENTAQMARAQNDLAMVNQCAETNSRGDNYGKGLELGIVTRAEYQRNAANICRFVMKLPSMDRMLGNKSELDISLESALSAADSELSSPVCIYEKNGKAGINPSLIRTGRGQNSLFQFFCEPNTSYTLTITCRAPEQSSLAQFSLAVYQDRKLAAVISINGSETKDTSFEIDIEPHFQGNSFIKFHSSHTGLIISGAVLNKKQQLV